MRKAEIKRKTAETDIGLTLCLDGSGKSDIQSGLGFLDHMLTLFAKHGRFDLELKCAGDTQVDVAGDGAGDAGEEVSVFGEEGDGDAAFRAEVQQKGAAHDVAKRDEAGKRVDGQSHENGAVLFGDDGFAFLPQVDALRLDVEGVEQFLHWAASSMARSSQARAERRGMSGRQSSRMEHDLQCGP